ncbi:MAG: hypothetical protein ABI876_12695 [Bacteroidota bacterium]
MTLNQLRAYSIAWGLLMGAIFTHAQPETLITKNPNGQLLHRIWTYFGLTPEQHDVRDGRSVGAAVSSLGDLDGDGLGDFALYQADGWLIYFGNAGRIDTIPTQVCTSFDHRQKPVVGRFWGGANKGIVFGRSFRSDSGFTMQLYHSTARRIDTVPAAMLNTRTSIPQIIVQPTDILAADLDGDGADELLLRCPRVQREGKGYEHAEIWIYKGGPTFTLDTPTVVLHDADSVGRWYSEQMVVGNFDDDGKPDIMVRDDPDYPDGIDLDTPSLNFWFSKPGSPWTWDTPDRTVPIRQAGKRHLEALDMDGDGLLDLAMPSILHRDGVMLFTTSGGKSYHTRLLDTSDVEASYICAITHNRSDGTESDLRHFGYLNDQTRRYAMLGLFWGGPGGWEPTLLGLGGGPHGPDSLYECYYHARYDSLFTGSGISTYEAIGGTAALGDVNGDGWDDLLCGNGAYTTNWGGSGIAYILAGGPDIPSAGVDVIAGEGHVSAISIWPNPAREALHVAWRGDLKRMPERFIVHDMDGHKVASGAVESWRGEAVWQCAGVANGTYLVTIYDHDGRVIATTKVIKQE